MTAMIGERARQARGGARWRRWGPYLAERAWGTVREDYSADGSAWEYFPHDHARSRAYRWGEDGIAGISDDEQRLCFALALWNGRDPILKERLFGLTGNEGNHGEDVKEYYYYLDAAPTHSYLRMLYKYPQGEYPYTRLVAENRRRGRADAEFELLDTGVFDGDRYFDVTVEYAQASPGDILVRIGAANRGPEAAELHLLPTLWFRNTWSWGDADDGAARPRLWRDDSGPGARIRAEHPRLGQYTLACEGAPTLLFTENETNTTRLFGAPSRSPYVKDGINDAVVGGSWGAVNPSGTGTKAAAYYRLAVAPGETATIRLRLTDAPGRVAPFARFEAIFARRRAEADAFYASLQPAALSDDERRVQRQAFAGLIWSKQFYHYAVDTWLAGDSAQPPPARRFSRNREWQHLNAAEIISMPDKWEYPWFAAWDLAFHCLPLALLDPAFAKEQLLLLLREWYQHPNGQIPAYEWAFGDVNPPVIAWAAWRVYQIEREQTGRGDRAFLERAFHKLLLNFTWWVNRKDAEGNNVFEGGFLGLDNIGVFDRGAPLPTGGHIEQSDGTSWMAKYCLDLLAIALELARENPAYNDIAAKFLEHLFRIGTAMYNIGGEGIALWDAADAFYYDALRPDGGEGRLLKVRSIVGLMPLCATLVFEGHPLGLLPDLRRRLVRFLGHHPELRPLLRTLQRPGPGGQLLAALVRGRPLRRLIARMLDEGEFLSPHGVRALSRYHAAHPYSLEFASVRHTIGYEPAEATSSASGANSNWRGPVWFPVNYLLIEALREFHRYYGERFTVECPTGSGRSMTLDHVADDLSQRLIGLFLRDASGCRPVFGEVERFQRDPHWRDLIPFHEYFHGDTGAGLGASHQTGWTGLVATLIQQQGEQRSAPAHGAAAPRPVPALR